MKILIWFAHTMTMNGGHHVNKSDSMVNYKFVTITRKRLSHVDMFIQTSKNLVLWDTKTVG